MEVSRITVDELKSKLDRGENIFLIDTRSPAAWSSSDIMIKNAVRIHYNDIDDHLSEIPKDRMIVTYCT
jgi:rhodanese-related sulfurtransferase